MLILCMAIGVLIVYLILFCFEYNISIVRGNIPFVASNRHHRRAVANEINTHYPTMQTACDVGSGYGGMSRYIARKCKINVVGLENMPVTAGISKIGDLFSRTRAKTIWCDAFGYLDTCDGFDIGIAYMGPGVNDIIGKYRNKFRVIITLDVPIKNMRATRTIELGHGYTTYGRMLGRHYKFPHKLFIYEMK